MGLPTGDDYVDELVRSLAGPRGGAGRDALKDGDARTSRSDGFDFDAFDFDAFARRERRREREYHAAWDAICRHADFANFREELPDGLGSDGLGSETRERAGRNPWRRRGVWRRPTRSPPCARSASHPPTQRTPTP